jgi:hypothetical protein
MRAGVVVFGDCGAGLEFELGGADCVFYEEDLLGTSGEGFEGSVFIPLGGRMAEGFVVCYLDGYVAERLVGLVAGYVGEGGGGEGGLAVLEFDGCGRLVLDGVDYLGGAKIDGDVVVAVPVQESVGVGRDFDAVDADVFVFQRQVVVGLGVEFDFGGCGLGGQEGGQEAEECAAFHAADCSTRLASTSGAKAQVIFGILRGAEAPLFHGIPHIHDIPRIRLGAVTLLQCSLLS